MSLAFITHLPQASQDAILNGPSLKPPPGVVPDLVDPPNRNDMVMGLVWFCLAISSILLLARIYERTFITRRVRIEDGMAFAAYGMFVSYVWACVQMLHTTGFYVHQWNVPVHKAFDFSYIIMLGSIFYAMNMMCIKIAILLDWLRIFVAADGKQRNAFYWLSWTLIMVNTAFYIAHAIAQALACFPTRAIWDKRVEGRCIDHKALDISSAAMNLITDIAILALVQKMIWRLQMSSKRKLGVSVVFAVGIFGCVAGVARLVVTIHFFRSDDLTYSVSDVIIWAAAEMVAGLFVFCVPVLPKFMTHAKVAVPTKVKAALNFLTGSASRAGKSNSNRTRNSWKQRFSDSRTRAPRVYQDLELDSYCQLEAKPEYPSEFESINGATDTLKSKQRGSLPANAILLTTRVSTASQEDCGGLLAEHNYHRQHPWTQRA